MRPYITIFGIITIITLGLMFLLIINYSSADSYKIELIQTFPGESSVSNAGDVNGDGFEDIIIGMDSLNDTGEAFIYFGGETIDDILDVHLKGEAVGDEFGDAVSSAGDVNGDGYSDVVVGASHYDTIATDTGRAYLFFGGNPMDSVPDVIFTGEGAQDYFGSAVSSGYDVNDDGFDDVIIGAWGYGEFLKPHCGKVYIIFGGSPVNESFDVTFTGQKEERFGLSLSSAGDIDNDGFDDVIIGAPGDVNNDPGWAYIFLGGNPMDNITDVILTGESEGDGFGVVSSAGDMNGDGYFDVIVGAPRNDSGGIDGGKVYLYLGENSMDNITDKEWIGEYDAKLGCALCNISDMNNDGFDDVIIGAYEKDDSGGISKGAVYIYYGNLTLNSFEEEIIYGYDSFRAFGISVSSGDINNDGYSDIIVGSWDYAYLFSPNFAPSLSIAEPDGESDLSDFAYLITWVDNDPDDDATISLYYCAEKSDNPISISGASVISEDNETDEFIWETSNILGGSYYIKAKIDDGVNPEVWVFSPGKVTINHPPQITITTPSVSNNDADESFLITWTDSDDEENATISLYYDTNDSGNDGTLIISDLSEDDEGDVHTWNTTNIPDGEYYVYAEINDGINPINTDYSEVPLAIHHKKPILGISGIQIDPSSPEDGDEIEITSTIRNSGDGKANNFAVKLFVDEIEMEEVMVQELLPNNRTHNVLFDPLILNSGSHTITIEVIYDGEEISDERQIVVKERQDGIFNLNLIILISLIVIVIIILIAFLLVRSKRKQSADDETTPSPNQISCPNCSYLFTIPSEPRPIQVHCPNCGTSGYIK